MSKIIVLVFCVFVLFSCGRTKDNIFETKPSDIKIIANTNIEMNRITGSDQVFIFEYKGNKFMVYKGTEGACLIQIKEDEK